jgi:3,4-dihydroxy 2-butanone 4-phosphate synthase/GTP cyclohydrolase II
MARRDELEVFAADHDLTMITIADLIDYRRHNEKQVARVAEARVPTAHGVFRAVGYDGILDGIEHIALVFGEIGDGERILVRMHSECLTGDVFGSLRCDCGPQLDAAMAMVAAEGRGVVLYVRGHDTVDVTGAQMLGDLGIRSTRLLTNDPDQRVALEGFGLRVIELVPLPVAHSGSGDTRRCRGGQMNIAATSASSASADRDDTSAIPIATR